MLRTVYLIFPVSPVDNELKLALTHKALYGSKHMDLVEEVRPVILMFTAGIFDAEDDKSAREALECCMLTISG